MNERIRSRAAYCSPGFHEESHGCQHLPLVMPSSCAAACAPAGDNIPPSHPQGCCRRRRRSWLRALRVALAEHQHSSSATDRWLWSPRLLSVSSGSWQRFPVAVTAFITRLSPVAWPFTSWHHPGSGEPSLRFPSRCPTSTPNAWSHCGGCYRGETSLYTPLPWHIRARRRCGACCPPVILSSQHSCAALWLLRLLPSAHTDVMVTALPALEPCKVVQASSKPLLCSFQTLPYISSWVDFFLTRSFPYI